jgi:guanine deaminase
MNATIHREATELLMQKLEDAGFVGYVGKVNMDRNSTDGLIETTEESIMETRTWLEDCKAKFKNVLPIITPRYTPCCTDEVMAGLSKLMKEYIVPVQSHLSEDLGEIEWVKELKPEIDYYAEAYDMYDMLGTATPTVMAHCVFPSDEEFELLIKRQTMIAHCPYCNATCTTAYAAPILKYLRAGARVGLGSDVAGSPMLNLWHGISTAMLASKMRWGFTERKNYKDFVDCITLSQGFYLATKGGGSFWDKMGSFEEGYAFDAVVIDESRNRDLNERPLRDRMERIVLMADERDTYAKYISGKKVYQKF